MEKFSSDSSVQIDKTKSFLFHSRSSPESEMNTRNNNSNINEEEYNVKEIQTSSKINLKNILEKYEEIPPLFKENELSAENYENDNIDISFDKFPNKYICSNEMMDPVSEKGSEDGATDESLPVAVEQCLNILDLLALLPFLEITDDDQDNLNLECMACMHIFPLAELDPDIEEISEDLMEKFLQLKKDLIDHIQTDAHAEKLSKEVSKINSFSIDESNIEQNPPHDNDLTSPKLLPSTSGIRIKEEELDVGGIIKEKSSFHNLWFEGFSPNNISKNINNMFSYEVHNTVIKEEFSYHEEYDSDHKQDGEEQLDISGVPSIWKMKLKEEGTKKYSQLSNDKQIANSYIANLSELVVLVPKLEVTDITEQFLNIHGINEKTGKKIVTELTEMVDVYDHKSIKNIFKELYMFSLTLHPTPFNRLPIQGKQCIREDEVHNNKLKRLPQGWVRNIKKRINGSYGRKMQVVYTTGSGNHIHSMSEAYRYCKANKISINLNLIDFSLPKNTAQILLSATQRNLNTDSALEFTNENSGEKYKDQSSSKEASKVSGTICPDISSDFDSCFSKFTEDKSNNEKVIIEKPPTRNKILLIDSLSNKINENRNKDLVENQNLVSEYRFNSLPKNCQKETNTANITKENVVYYFKDKKKITNIAVDNQKDMSQHLSNNTNKCKENINDKENENDKSQVLSNNESNIITENQNIDESSSNHEISKEIKHCHYRIPDRDKLFQLLRLQPSKRKRQDSETGDMNSPTKKSKSSDPYDVTRTWLLDNFRMAEDHAVTHHNIAKFYQEFCTKENVQPLNSNLFVKLTRALYPSVLYRRLGKRIENKYIYEGLTVRNDSKYQMRDQEDDDNMQPKPTTISKHPTKLQELIRQTLEMPIPSTTDQSTADSPFESNENYNQSDVIHEASSSRNLSLKKTNARKKSSKTLAAINCPVCDRKFSLISALKVHIQNHFLVESDNGIGNSECTDNIIDLENEVNDNVSKFKVNNNLDEVCPLCRTKVSNKENLKLHMQACPLVIQASSITKNKCKSSNVNLRREVYQNIHSNKISKGLDNSEKKRTLDNELIDQNEIDGNVIKCNRCFRVSIEKNEKRALNMNCVGCKAVPNFTIVSMNDYFQAMRNCDISMLLECLECGVLLKDRKSIISHIESSHKNIKILDETDGLYKTHLISIDDYLQSLQEDRDTLHLSLLKEMEPQDDEIELSSLGNEDFWKEKYRSETQKNNYKCSTCFKNFPYLSWLQRHIQNNHQKQVHDNTPVPVEKQVPLTISGNINFESVSVEDDDMDDYDDYDDEDFYYFEDEDDEDSFDKECSTLTVDIVKPGKASENVIQNDEQSSPVSVDSVTIKRISHSSPHISSINKHKCPFCIASFNSNDKILQHITTHKELRNFITLPSVEKLTNRLTQSHFNCSFCKKKFITIDGLKVHENKHKCKPIHIDGTKNITENTGDNHIKSGLIKNVKSKDSSVISDSSVNTTMEDPFVEEIVVDEDELDVHEIPTNNSGFINLRIDPQNNIISVLPNKRSRIEPLVNSITLLDKVTYLNNKLNSRLSDKSINRIPTYDKDILVLNTCELENKDSNDDHTSKRKASLLQNNFNIIKKSSETKKRKKSVAPYKNKDEIDPFKYLGMKCEKGEILSLDTNKLAVTTICAICTCRFKPEFDLQKFKKFKLESTVSCPNCETEFLYQYLWPELRLILIENESTNIPKNPVSEEMIDLNALNQSLKELEKRKSNMEFYHPLELSSSNCSSPMLSRSSSPVIINIEGRVRDRNVSNDDIRINNNLETNFDFISPNVNLKGSDHEPEDNLGSSNLGRTNLIIELEATIPSSPFCTDNTDNSLLVNECSSDVALNNNIADVIIDIKDVNEKANQNEELSSKTDDFACEESSDKKVRLKRRNFLNTKTKKAEENEKFSEIESLSIPSNISDDALSYSQNNISCSGSESLKMNTEDESCTKNEKKSEVHNIVISNTPKIPISQMERDSENITERNIDPKKKEIADIGHVKDQIILSQVNKECKNMQKSDENMICNVDSIALNTEMKESIFSSITTSQIKENFVQEESTTIETLNIKNISPFDLEDCSNQEDENDSKKEATLSDILSGQQMDTSVLVENDTSYIYIHVNKGMNLKDSIYSQPETSHNTSKSELDLKVPKINDESNNSNTINDMSNESFLSSQIAEMKENSNIVLSNIRSIGDEQEEKDKQSKGVLQDENELEEKNKQTTILQDDYELKVKGKLELKTINKSIFGDSKDKKATCKVVKDTNILSVPTPYSRTDENLNVRGFKNVFMQQHDDKLQTEKNTVHQTDRISMLRDGTDQLDEACKLEDSKEENCQTEIKESEKTKIKESEKTEFKESENKKNKESEKEEEIVVNYAESSYNTVSLLQIDEACEQELTCKMCNFTCDTEGVMIVHRRVTHLENYYCSRCSAPFQFAYQLKKHKQRCIK